MKNKIVKTAAAIALSLSIVAAPSVPFCQPLRAEAVVDAETGARQLGVTVSNKIVPAGNLAQGRPYGIAGTINSKLSILQVFGGVYSSDGQTKILYVEDSPSSTTYDLRTKFDNLLTFNTLPSGSYKYRIVARTVQDDIVVAESDFTVGNAGSSASAGITVTGKKVPENGITYGKPCSISGVLSSPSAITAVYGGIYTSDGATPVIYCEDSPYTTTYDLGGKFDNSLTFDKLAPGNYVYKIFARNASGECVVAESKFYISLIPSEKIYAGLWEQTAYVNVLSVAGSDYKVVSSAKGKTSDGLPAWEIGVQKIDGSDPNVYVYYAGYQFTYPASVNSGSSAISISGNREPSGTIAQGQPCIIGGIITSPSAISKVWGGVYTSDGNTAVLTCEDFPYTASYNLGTKFDNYLTFNTLAPGSYTYKIFARNSQGDTTVTESSFSVKGNSSNASGNNGQTKPVVTISGNTMPSGTLVKGRPFGISGVINSNLTIGQVFGGIYSEDGQKSVIFCSDSPASTSYDLSRIFDNKLTFNTLPSGNYTYKIIVRTVSDDVVIAKSNFTVA